MSKAKSMKYIRNILAALRRADRDFSLIDDGDKILIGLSGGKDSLALLRALSVYDRFAGKHFEITPVYLDLGFGNSDLTELKGYCASLGHPLYVSDSRFVYDILKAHTKVGHHIPCSICSRMKKAAMNNIAHKLGYNKVAFAHHNDDAVETLFMNMVHGGRVATFEPKMRLERAKITFIRPLIYCKESDLRNLCEEENLPVLTSKCPANGFTEREWTKEFVHNIYKSHPEAYDNFRGLLTNYQSFCLYFDKLEYESEEKHEYAIKPAIFATSCHQAHFLQRNAKKGEQDFFILLHHNRVGEICYRYLNDHRIEIFGLYGNKEAKRVAINELVDRLKKDTNPVTFVLMNSEKALVPLCGFLLKEEPGQTKPHFIKYIKQ
jgi:tRNA 2-thiocytidine biosynthesis protein TtcA